MKEVVSPLDVPPGAEIPVCIGRTFFGGRFEILGDWNLWELELMEPKEDGQ